MTSCILSISHWQKDNFSVRKSQIPPHAKVRSSEIVRTTSCILSVSHWQTMILGVRKSPIPPCTKTSSSEMQRLMICNFIRLSLVEGGSQCTEAADSSICESLIRWDTEINDL